MVWGGGKGFRRVGGANLVVLDQTLVVEVDVDLSSSAEEDGGGRSPYKPPNIVTTLLVCDCVKESVGNWEIRA